MSEWLHKTVEELAAPRKAALSTGPFGSAIGSDTFRASGVPVIRGGNLSSETGVRLIDDGLVFIEGALAEKFSRSIVRHGDLVFTCWGTIDQVGFIDQRARYDQYVISNKQMKFSPDPMKIIPLFAYYFFCSPEGKSQMANKAIGSSVPGFNLSGLRSIYIPVPPLVQQRKIVSILGALDEKIELNRRMNETLEAMARAIFKDWFVDFGPTRAKMEGRPPYLASDLWSLFPDRLDDEGKPEGWQSGFLSAFASLNSETWSRADYPDSVDYVDLSNTKWGTIEAVTRFTRHEAPSRAQRILRPGDTIFGTVRPGNGSYAFVSVEGLTGSTGFAVLRPNQSIYREVIYLAVSSLENIDRLAHLADGGAYPAVRPETVSVTEIIVAPEHVYSKFSVIASGFIDRAEANKLENRTLAATRDLLLPKLMSGEIRIKDAEKAVEEVS